MNELNVCELQKNDFFDTAVFLASVFGGTVGEKLDLFAHWWEANPAWSPNIPRGWIARSKDNAVIAHTANIPFNYIIDGNPGLCCATGSTAVHSDWRGRGLSKSVGLPFVNQPDADLVIGVGSTELAYRLWLSIGMEPLKIQWPARSRALVGSLAVLAESKLKRLPTGCVSLAAHAGKLLAIPRRGQSDSRSISVERVDRFETVDSDSIGHCRASKLSTYAIRDTKTLNWLYFGSDLVRRSRAAFVARSGKHLIGFLGMKRTGHSFYLLECRCRDASPEIARELLYAARAHAENENAPFIRVWLYTPMLEAAIPKLVSIPTKKPLVMTYCYLSRSKGIDPSNWETTPGDGDLSVY